MMKVICLIPARLESERLPNKMLIKIGKHNLIAQTYLSALETKVFDEVWVATDNHEIGKEIENLGGKVFYSKLKHFCGSDRIAEAALEMEADIIMNIQGDTPLVSVADLQKIVQTFKEDSEQEIDLISLMIPIHKEKDIHDPNTVKVITDQSGFAMYFSRSPIPYPRNNEVKHPYHKHIGIYAFRKKALIDFWKSPQTPLEQSELIECIRHLEMGKKIKMLPTDFNYLSIDVYEDLAKFEGVFGV